MSDDVLESLETGRTTAIEAMRRFIDQVTPVIADQSRRKAIIDAALNWLKSSTLRASNSCAALSAVQGRR